MFAFMLMLNRHFQMQLFCWRLGLNNVFCVYTEAIAQYDTVTFEYNHASFSAVTYVLGRPVLITHSRGSAFTVTKYSYNIPNTGHHMGK